MRLRYHVLQGAVWHLGRAIRGRATLNADNIPPNRASQTPSKRIMRNGMGVRLLAQINANNVYVHPPEIGQDEFAGVGEQLADN